MTSKQKTMPQGGNKGVGDAVFQFGFQKKRNTHVFRYREDQKRVLWRQGKRTLLLIVGIRSIG